MKEAFRILRRRSQIKNLRSSAFICGLIFCAGCALWDQGNEMRDYQKRLQRPPDTNDTPTVFYIPPAGFSPESAVRSPQPNTSPLSVIDTNDYEETLQYSWPSVPGAVLYHICLETNGHAICADLTSSTNSIEVTVPATNAYSLLAIMPSDGTNIVQAGYFAPGQFWFSPIQATMVTVSAQGPLGTVQLSSDLIHWTTIATGLMETNLTYSINRKLNQFWRTVPAQPLVINAHY